VRATQPFVRLLVRVPEAYALLEPFEASRPGLLVLDADGRRVEMIDLAAVTDRAEIATRLEKAATAPAVERIRVSLDGAAGLLPSTLKGVKGIRDVGVRGRELIITAEPGAAVPAVLREKADKLALRFEDPAEVTLSGDEQAPGAWYVEAGRAYVPRVLVDAAWKIASLETRTIDLEGVGKGPRAARVPFAALAVAGVLTAVPDFEQETLTVVARKEDVDWDAVEKAVAAVR